MRPASCTQCATLVLLEGFRSRCSLGALNVLHALIVVCATDSAVDRLEPRNTRIGLRIVGFLLEVAFAILLQCALVQ